MQKLNYKRTKLACYLSCFTMASAMCLPPLLFVTFYEKYDISWKLIGTLIAANFLTQLGIDLIFSAFSNRFNVKIALRIMPLVTAFGMFFYALSPFLFKGHEFFGLMIGTVIFSVAAGLSEVLLSPTVAALPSKTPQRDMSFLHSLYGVGVFTVVVISALFIKFVGAQYWMYLTMFFAALPIIAAVLFIFSPIPDMKVEEGKKRAEKSKKNGIGILLCVLCIFLGACSEITMTNWISSFMETEFHIDKAVGDVVGMAGFAVLLAATRIAYAKWGKNIWKTLFLGMIGAAVCYLVAGLSPYTVPAFIACILTGVFTAMLWPGTLIYMEEKMPNLGVAAYALMAAGGDFGGSAAPQLMGIVVDATGSFQTGMLVSAIFPVLGVVVTIVLWRYFKHREKTAREGFAELGKNEK